MSDENTIEKQVEIARKTARLKREEESALQYELEASRRECERQRGRADAFQEMKDQAERRVEETREIVSELRTTVGDLRSLVARGTAQLRGTGGEVEIPTPGTAEPDRGGDVEIRFPSLDQGASGGVPGETLYRDSLHSIGAERQSARRRALVDAAKAICSTCEQVGPPDAGPGRHKAYGGGGGQSFPCSAADIWKMVEDLGVVTGAGPGGELPIGWEWSEIPSQDGASVRVLYACNERGHTVEIWKDGGGYWLDADGACLGAIEAVLARHRRTRKP